MSSDIMRMRFGFFSDPNKEREKRRSNKLKKDDVFMILMG
jgi:hypothetical protein